MNGRADDWGEWEAVVGSGNGEHDTVTVWAGDGWDADMKAREAARKKFGPDARVEKLREKQSYGYLGSSRLDACQSALDDLGQRLDALERDERGSFRGTTEEKLKEASRLNEENEGRDPESFDRPGFFSRIAERDPRGSAR